MSLPSVGNSNSNFRTVRDVSKHVAQVGAREHIFRWIIARTLAPAPPSLNRQEDARQVAYLEQSAVHRWMLCDSHRLPRLIVRTSGCLRPARHACARCHRRSATRCACRSPAGGKINSDTNSLWRPSLIASGHQACHGQDRVFQLPQRSDPDRTSIPAESIHHAKLSNDWNSVCPARTLPTQIAA
jgi:hypothetical protein